jgi:hypothetical protein
MTAMPTNIPASWPHAETMMSAEASTGPANGDQAFLRRRGAQAVQALPNLRHSRRYVLESHANPLPGAVHSCGNVPNDGPSSEIHGDYTSAPPR